MGRGRQTGESLRFPCRLCSPIRSRATHTLTCIGLGHVRGHDPAGGRRGRSKGASRAVCPPGAPGRARLRALPPTILQRGGQALVGGLHVQVCRNFFSALRCGISGGTRRLGALDYLHSRLRRCRVSRCRSQCPARCKNSGTDDEAADAAASPHRAVFIRAPAIMTASEDVEVLAKVSAVPSARRARGDRSR